MNDKDRIVLFLDIDGVLQPSGRQIRHKISNEERESLPGKLADKFHNPIFLSLNVYDVAAVFYDWEKDAVSNLKSILDYDYGNGKKAEIVLSSDWRQTKNYEKMKTLFQIHGLDKYLTELVPQTRQFSTKEEDLAAYLQNHESLSNYLIVDDYNFGSKFLGHFYYVKNYWLKKDDADKIICFFKDGAASV